MSRDSSLDDNPMEDSQDSEETCQQFDEVRKYFSEEQCAKLGNLGQRICVYMKKNYEYLIRQGLISIVPRSKHPNNQTTEARNDSDEAQDPGNHGSFQAAAPVLELRGSRKEETNAWLGRLRERKNYVVYEEISDPEEDD